MEIQTQKNITKQASKQKAKQTKIKNWTKTHRVETEASAEGRKRKRVEDTEKAGGKAAQKFQFNKKGKLTIEEVAELSRTNKNIFSWLNPVKTVVEVIEPAEDVEDMEVVDTVREERLERVRMRQLEWAASMHCKDVIKEMIGKAVELSEERVCRELIEEEVVE